jgi:HSP90 family molecular chaperone
VLSELVANAYDARARRVDIVLGEDDVTLQDDGVGMDRDDVQEKYLVVGRDRRLAEPTLAEGVDPFPSWPRRDKPMGRKGIGKLAMFSIANQVELVSTKSGTTVALKMDREKIEQAAKTNATFFPEEFDATPLARGTRIVLKQLRRERAISPERTLKSIARRFRKISG